MPSHTGARGVVNGLANAGYSTITLGFGDRVQVTDVDDFDRYYGHDTIAGVTQIAGEFGLGLATGGLANVSRAGKLANLGRVACPSARTFTQLLNPKCYALRGLRFLHWGKCWGSETDVHDPSTSYSYDQAGNLEKRNLGGYVWRVV